MLFLVRRLWGHLNSARRVQLAILFILMLCSAFAELISIGMVIPFLGILINPELIFNKEFMQPVIIFFDLRVASELLLPITLIFILTVILSSVIRFALILLQTKICLGIVSEIAVSAYLKALHQPYEVHISRNSSEVISGIISKVGNGVGATISPLLTIISTILIVLMVFIPLVIFNPLITLILLLALSGIYGIVILFTKRKLVSCGSEINQASTDIIKVLNEGLGGIRDILIDGNQSAFGLIYRKADLRLRGAQANIQIISSSPKFVIETLAIITISIIAYLFSTKQAGLLAIIPALGAIAIGAQRLLPMLQQTFSSWALIQGGREPLKDVLDLLDQPVQKEYLSTSAQVNVPFEREIWINNLCFQYNQKSPYILNNFSLRIPKGARIGFIGITGSGKSTLLDLVMGLLKPIKGNIFIDEKVLDSTSLRGWQSHIAHVPQSIFLADASIAENIAFGVPSDKINLDQVKVAAKQAQLTDVIEALQLHYDSPVGDRGVQLSGGQRQRIGIARALYKKADVIILDEATSALDLETERKIMQTIDGLGEDITVLIIAHRLVTLKNCTQIIELRNGEVMRTGNYVDIVES
jgi:ABC-type multidrug transport system fused ATPase/permease subunit